MNVDGANEFIDHCTKFGLLEANDALHCLLILPGWRLFVANKTDFVGPTGFLYHIFFKLNTFSSAIARCLRYYLSIFILNIGVPCKLFCAHLMVFVDLFLVRRKILSSIGNLFGLLCFYSRYIFKCYTIFWSSY